MLLKSEVRRLPNNANIILLNNSNYFLIPLVRTSKRMDMKMKTNFVYLIMYILVLQERNLPDAYFQMDCCEISGLFTSSVDSTDVCPTSSKLNSLTLSKQNFCTIRYYFVLLGTISINLIILRFQFNK